MSPNAKPPVCKIIEYGKFKYAAQKKAAEARKKQKTVEVKEIKFRPNIDTNDYEIKMRSVRKFINAGDKVKITMRFRGREMTHQDIGVKVLRRIREDLDTTVKIEQFPKLEGRQMVQVFAPNISEKGNTKGDKRVFIINGLVKGAIQRVPRKDSFVSNLAQGGKATKTKFHKEAVKHKGGKCECCGWSGEYEVFEFHNDDESIENKESRVFVFLI